MASIRYPEAGFKFDNYQRHSYYSTRLTSRNLSLTQNGFKEPRHTSTGTTIVGVKFKNGVILGADTRATAGTIIADKNCEKIHYLAPNIWCAGAGTAADTDFTTSLISSNLALHGLSTGRTSRGITAVTQLKQYLFRYQGHIGAYLIVAGVDPTGAHLFSVHAHGSTDKLPYMTLGSGSLAAMGVLECDYRVGLEKEEAMDLVCRAVLAGIWNDLGSGGSVDLVVIEKDKVESFPVDGANVAGYSGVETFYIT